VILCGDDEVTKNLVTIKNLKIGKVMSDSFKDRVDWKNFSGSQKTVAFDKLLNEIV
jgi:histidyl-tRNA synthetase